MKRTNVLQEIRNMRFAELYERQQAGDGHTLLLGVANDATAEREIAVGSSH